MPTLEVPANELKDVCVSFVSLVKRGANRLPIRMMKGDDSVLDLSTFLRKRDVVEAVAQIAKQDEDAARLAEARKLVEAAGYSVAKQEPVVAGEAATVILVDKPEGEQVEKAEWSAEEKAIIAAMSDEEKKAWDSMSDEDRKLWLAPKLVKADHNGSTPEDQAAAKPAVINGIPVMIDPNSPDGSPVANAPTSADPIPDDPHFIKKSVTEALAGLKDVLAAQIGEALKPVAEAVQANTSAVSAFGERLAVTEAAVTKQDQALTGLVTGRAAGDPTPSTRTQKSEPGLLPPIDTAFSRV